MAMCVVCCAPAKMYCENDQAYLCVECDTAIHNSNLVAAKHSRVPTCDLCFSVMAQKFCRNDNAFLCLECDQKVHSSNPLAARHEVVAASLAFFEQKQCCQKAPACVEKPTEKQEKQEKQEQSDAHSETGNVSKKDEPTCSLEDLHVVPNVSDDSTWKPFMSESHDGDAFRDMQILELDNSWLERLDLFFPEVGGDDALMEGQKAAKRISTISSDFCQELKVELGSTGVVSAVQGESQYMQPVKQQPTTLDDKLASGLTREQRVMRYREKRKRRKFEKTIRYASRKAYAEVRPRIKGRFAKREVADPWAAVPVPYEDEDYLEDLSDAGVVPDFPAF